ncbi:MAG: sugar ABC transporter permease [Chloroflexota bacterium]
MMKLSYKRKQQLSGYLFVLLPTVGTLLLTIYPLASSIYNSFFMWNSINPRQFVGWENYQWMFTIDKQVLTSMKATLTYLLYHVPGVVSGGLIFAVLLNNPRLRGVRLARTIVITPLVTASMAIAAVWMFVFNPNIGILNAIIQEWFGGQPLNWYGKPNLAMIVLLVVSIWRGIGYSFVFLLAGLQNIPVQLLEAAKVDGANSWQAFRRITIPLLTPTIFLVLVLVFLGAAQEFEMPLVLTKGGPRWTTSLINLTIYRVAFDYTRVGYASAIATITFLFLLAGTLFQFFMQRRWVFYRE